MILSLVLSRRDQVLTVYSQPELWIFTINISSHAMEEGGCQRRRSELEHPFMLRSIRYLDHLRKPPGD